MIQYTSYGMIILNMSLVLAGNRYFYVWIIKNIGDNRCYPIRLNYCRDAERTIVVLIQGWQQRLERGPNYEWLLSIPIRYYHPLPRAPW
jgi:hypothetical protein